MVKAAHPSEFTVNTPSNIKNAPGAAIAGGHWVSAAAALSQDGGCHIQSFAPGVSTGPPVSPTEEEFPGESSADTRSFSAAEG